MTDCVLIDACRTPFVRADAELAKETAVDLGVRTATALISRSPLSIEQVDGLIAGNVGSPCDAANIARVIGLTCGFPISLTAHTVARNCASGIEAVTTAIEKIRAGTGECYLCVTTESMSQYPLIMKDKLAQTFKKAGKAKSAWGAIRPFLSLRGKDIKPRIALLEGLRDPTNGMLMGDTADLLAREYEISRQEQDEFALESHQRAVKAQEDNLFDEEIVPYFTSRESASEDVGPRKEQSAQSLAKLKPVFDRRWGTVTVGNACGITDGSASLLISSESFAQKNDLPILAKIKDFAWTGCDPKRMGLGPVSSSQMVLKRQQLRFSNIDIVELNEAFAAQVLACLKAFEQDNTVGVPSRKQLNPLGGAIAIGHPVGATGGRLLLSVATQLKRNNLRQGLATLCIGGGQGGAVLLENPNA